MKYARDKYKIQFPAKTGTKNADINHFILQPGIYPPLISPAF